MIARPRMKRLYTEEEYFALEEKSETKHEFYQGEIFAMTGGSANHDRIAGDVFTACNTMLQNSDCEAFTANMRIRIEAHGLNTYPDVSVVCGGVRFVENRNDTITNPRVVVEVLSPSTKDYDRGEKFDFYRSIPTLREYVLIHQDNVHVEHHRKQDGGWLLTDLTSLDEALALSSVGVEIPMPRIYARVDWLDSNR